MRKLVKAATLLLGSVFVAVSAYPCCAADLPTDYIKTVDAAIHKTLVYPRMAKMREQQGTVGFVVNIDAHGAVAQVAVENSSGNTSLDNAAIEAVNNAAPFPAPPGGTATIHTAVAFTLH